MKPYSKGSGSLVASLILSGLVLSSAACSREPLDADTALSLIREHRADPVIITFSAAPGWGQSDPRVKQAYDRLIEDHVLTCAATGSAGTLCQPGPAGAGITQSGSTDLSLIAGQWTPSVITKINRVGTGPVTGEARMVFEPSALYKEYQEAIDVIQNTSEGRTSQAEQKEGKIARVSFIHAEDGWHLDTLQ